MVGICDWFLSILSKVVVVVMMVAINASKRFLLPSLIAVVTVGRNVDLGRFALLLPLLSLLYFVQVYSFILTMMMAVEMSC